MEICLKIESLFKFPTTYHFALSYADSNVFDSMGIANPTVRWFLLHRWQLEMMHRLIMSGIW